MFAMRTDADGRHFGQRGCLPLYLGLGTMRSLQPSWAQVSSSGCSSVDADSSFGMTGYLFAAPKPFVPATRITYVFILVAVCRGSGTKFMANAATHHRVCNPNPRLHISAIVVAYANHHGPATASSTITSH